MRQRFSSNTDVVPLAKSDVSARQVFYQLISALYMLSQGLAELTLGRMDEFGAAEIKSFEGN